MAEVTEVKPIEISTELQEKFGIKTVEELENVINTAKSLTDKETEFTTKENGYKSQLDELSGKLNAYESNPFVKEVATVAIANPDKLDTFLSLRNVNDATTGKDAFALRMKIEKGWKDADIADEIEATFGKLPDDAEEEEIAKYNQRIERNFATHKDWLKEEKQKLVFVAPKPTGITEEEADAVTEAVFAPHKEKKEFYKVDVAVDADKWKEAGLDEELKLSLTHEVPFDEERKNKVKSYTKHFAKQNNLKNTKENLDSTNYLLALNLKGEYYDADLKTLIEQNTYQVAKQVAEYYQKKFSIGTPRAPTQTKTPTAPFSVSDSTDQAKFRTPKTK